MAALGNIPSTYNRWLNFTKIMKDRIPEGDPTDKDFFVVHPTTVKLPNQSATALRDLVVFDKLTFIPKNPEDEKSPDFTCRDIYVLGGEVDFQGIHVTARYIIQIPHELFSLAVRKLRREAHSWESPFPRNERVPSSCSSTRTFTLRPDIDAQNFNGFTGLMTAARFEDYEVVKLFLAAKADPNIMGKDGWRALKLATLTNSGTVVELLSEAKANLEAVDSSGRTVLMTACVHKFEMAARSLIAAGANLYPQKVHGQTLLSAATKSGAVEIVNSLVEARANVYADPLAAPGYMSTEVMYAAANGLTGSIERIIAEGLETEVTNDACQRPLLLAARYGHPLAVALLIDAQANLEASILGETSLLKAAREGHTSVVAILLGAKANINAADVRGTALMGAAEKSHAAIITLLVAADPEGAVKLLIQAGRLGQMSIVKSLLAEKLLTKKLGILPNKESTNRQKSKLSTTSFNKGFR